MWYKSITEMIGNTPLLELGTIAKDVDTTILAKLEGRNPGGSIKDRTALNMICSAEKEGKLSKGDTILETSSGNTGIGVSLIASLRGYHAIIVVTESVNSQKEQLMKALGSEIIKCKNYEEQYHIGKQILQENPDVCYINQMDNPQNVLTHYNTTGPEIWKQTNGRVDYVITGLGSGGTASGAGKYLKEKKSRIKIIGVDGINSVYYNNLKHRTISTFANYSIEGLGNFKIQDAMHLDQIDDIIEVSEQDAINTSKELLRKEGLLVGASSGAIVSAALTLSEKINSKSIIVTILPDTGYTYLNKYYQE